MRTNYRQHQQPLKTYDIHPTSIKLIQKGHPWITVDKFSEKFHPKERFIIASNRSRPFALLIHDPTHKNVRARVWAKDGNFQKQMKSFKNDLAMRMRKAIQKRAKADYTKKRNNFYLIFGEGDNIPGVFAHYLNGEILLQIYMRFWDHYQDYLIKTLLTEINNAFKKDLTYQNIWLQTRSHLKEPAQSNDPMFTFKNVDIEEYGVNYKVVLGKFYDHGIYTDMSSIRGRITDNIKEGHRVLNLFSYTGAFSLFAMKNGADHVTSVDLSETYLEWLEENIKLNEDLNLEKHRSLQSSTSEALAKLSNDKEQFNFIICDPPSSSSDGQKRSNALNDYKENLPKIASLLDSKGQILIFLNTHKCSMKKFDEKIRTIINEKKLNLEIIKKFYLGEDCPSKKGFPEGNYLKGILLKKND